MVNMHDHSSLFVSSLLKNETYNHEHSSFSMSRSLKYETDPPPIELILPLDLVPKTSFPSPISFDPLSSSLFGEPIPISGHESIRVEKKIQRKKQILGGMSLAFGHHVGVKPLSFVGHVGEKLPTYKHHAVIKHVNGYHLRTVSFSVSSSHKNETNPKKSFFLIQACVKMKPTQGIVYFLVPRSCKNETNPKHIFCLFQPCVKMKPIPSIVFLCFKLV